MALRPEKAALAAIKRVLAFTWPTWHHGTYSLLAGSFAAARRLSTKIADALEEAKTKLQERIERLGHAQYSYKNAQGHALYRAFSGKGLRRVCSAAGEKGTSYPCQR